MILKVKDLGIENIKSLFEYFLDCVKTKQF